MRLIILAGVVGMVFSLFFTPLLIKALQRRGRTQAIRVSKDGIKYPEHQNKIGTPSMGGLAILGGTVVGYAAAHIYVLRPPTYSVMLAFLLMGGLALVGFVDDYLKIYKQNSRGIRARTKLFGQAVVAIVFGYLAVNGANANGVTPASTSLSFVRDTLIVLPIIVFLIWVWFLVTAMTNAVNLSDGLDGLAAGASILTFAGYILISVFQFNQSCAFEVTASCYTVRDPLDLAVFAAAIGGSLIGFLWWNTSPARIFMGDTGSLAIGGAIAALAIFTRTQLLMSLMGGLFLLVTLSVVIQVTSFKLTGKRVFKMAPLHHHFEMSGWPEIQIVVRFWVIQGIMLAGALALFYAEWVRFI
jgi:phospho-N-acetylmuramoyl-pentapeptide-transferase